MMAMSSEPAMAFRRSSVIRVITYASCYVYSPTGSGTVCEQSRLLRALLKTGDAAFMLKYAVRVRQEASDSPLLAGFFGASDVLVPVPGSRAAAAGRFSPAECLAVALVNQGLGRAAWSCLRRFRTVRKSATAAPGERPTVSLHYESFCIEPSSTPPETIILVDDVVTKGRTLLAAASRLHEAFPATRIRAFALVRTMGLVPEVRRLLDPCQGEIRWENGDARRSP
jgi:predicted amidophosphoribosyltransferase